MPTMLVNNNDQNNIESDSQLFTNPLYDEPGIDETFIDKSVEIPLSSRPMSSYSGDKLTTNRKKRTKTRSYKFIQLERALIAANLLKNNDDRLQFENEYLHSIHHHTFDQFTEKYYKKIRNHFEQIKQEQTIKQARIFTFIDVEKNFLALDPSRDVKIIFLDEPSSSTRIKSAHQRTKSAAIDDHAAADAFYDKRSKVLLENPSLARDEITRFARRQAERLHERLPRLTSVPHRVKVIDERDLSGQPDERTLLQIKHKRALSVINQRRQVIMKMINQSRKNQIKMEELWNQPTLTIDSSACCRELLERANQIDRVVQEEEEEEEQQQQHTRQRPQTAVSSRKRAKQNASSMSTTFSSMMTTTTITTGNIASSSNKTPFQDALSVDQMERTKTVRVLVPTRPLTAPMRVNWINYC